MLLSQKNDQRRLRPLLGTFVEVRARDSNHAKACAAIEKAYAAIAIVEKRMSAHDPGSDLGRLWKHGAGKPVEVHPWTYRVIHAGLYLHRLSGGIFDIGAGKVMERRGFVPVWPRAKGRGTLGDSSDVELLGACRISLRRPVRIDLGGIAKGFAVDRAVDALRTAGIKQGCVNAGGDFRIFGSCAEPLVLRHPGRPRQIVRVGEIGSGAAATSGTYFSRRRRNHHVFTALIDGRTGRHRSLRRSITILAPSAMWADALTKIVAVDLRPGISLLRRFHAHALLLERRGSRLELASFPATGDDKATAPLPHNVLRESA